MHRPCGVYSVPSNGCQYEFSPGCDGEKWVECDIECRNTGWSGGVDGLGNCDICCCWEENPFELWYIGCGVVVTNVLATSQKGSLRGAALAFLDAHARAASLRPW
jgi:hypothetical protein